MVAQDPTSAKERILQAAEELFSEHGFQGTSVARIAQEAQVNKALIYYYFKDKNDIVASLFDSILEEAGEATEQALATADGGSKTASTGAKIEAELTFLSRKRGIVSVMLMESLKLEDEDHYLFRCFEKLIAHHIGDKPGGGADDGSSEEAQLRLVYEFFTGFVPMMAFAALQDSWCEYFRCDEGRLLDQFLEAFRQTHLASGISHLTSSSGS